MQRVPFCATCCKPYALQGSGRPVGQRIPKLLDCSHTFCQGCVIKYAGNETRVLNCPTCKEQTLLPGGKKNVKNLPTNLYILGILINNVRANIEKDITKGELLDFEFEKTDLNAGPSKGEDDGVNEPRGVVFERSQDKDIWKVCDECSNSAAVSQCQKCEAIFCESCFDSVHSSSRTLRSHEPLSLALMHFPGVMTQTCETHEGRELEFYDHTDAKLICSLCIVTPAYQGHKIVSAHELTNDITEKIKQQLQSVKKVYTQLQKSKGKLALLLPAMKTEFSEAVQHIREHFQDLHTNLQAREVNLIREVKEVYCSKTFPNQLAKEINQQSEEITTLIKQVNTALSAPSVMMKIGETLLSRMADYEDIPCVLPESFLHDLVMISYPKEIQDALNSYGTIVSETSDLSLKRISEQPDDISEDETEESSTVFTERSDHQLQASSQITSSPHILTMPSRQNLVTVSHISIPTNFFIQHVADMERLENLMEAIQTHCNGARGVNDAVKSTAVGDLVCAKGASDEWWYRARIVGEQQQSSIPKGRNQSLPKVKVCFIDYGNNELVPLNRLRKMPPKFANIPELTTSCSLVDIVPPGQCTTWPNGSIKAFGSMVRDKHLLMGVVKKKSGKLLVDLKSPDTDRSTASDKPASVRDALVFLEVAKFTSPASVPNTDISFPVYTYPKVSLPAEDEIFQVMVTYTETPDSMYVQRYSGQEYDDMLKVLQQMLNVYSSQNGDQWQVGWPYKDMVCAARYSEDQNWYRALVVDVSPDKNAKVLFVDFGNSEELPFSEIRRLPDHLTKLPRQAMKCRLAGIRPADEENGWTDECSSFLIENCYLHPYQMKVVEAEGDEAMSVVLSLPTPQPAPTLNQQLVLNSHAALSTINAECLAMTSVVEPSSPASNASTRVSEADDGTSSVNSEQGKLLYPQRLSYKPVDMPESNQFQFLVTYVDKDCTISGFQPDKRDHSLADFMRHMHSICKDKDGSSVTQDQLSFNQPCCARYSDDNEWYRAQIVGFPTPSTVLVDYVDFGNREEIPLTSISLNAAFLDIPKQCLAITLEGLPQTPVEQEKVSRLLEGLLVGKICEAKSSATMIRDSVINIEHLTLQDGRDVVDVARDMMSRQHSENLEEKPCANLSPKLSPYQPLNDKTKSKKMKSQSTKSILGDTVLPVEGIPFDVAVTQINSKNVVFLQREIPSEGSPRLADGHDPTHIIACDHLHQMLNMSNKINFRNYFDGKSNVENVWNNMLCCARYTEDDLWYRAQVSEVVTYDPLRARVLYVDYGTSEVIGLERMKPFPAELASLPKQAFQCTIVGLSDENDDEPDDGIDLLANVVTGQKLICKVASFGSPIEVELYERVFNENSYEDVPISQRVSEFDVMADYLENDAAEDVKSNDELSEKEEMFANKEEYQLGNDGETEDFSADENPVGDWYSEYEETFMKYNREGLSTRPQLLTPAQFLLTKENLVEHGKTDEAEESEVD